MANCEKKGLNSDSQQFNQYQQNEQPPLTSQNIDKTKPFLSQYYI